MSINAKSIIVLIFALSIGMSLWAQKPTPEVQATIDACVSLQHAVGSGSTEGLKQANAALKKCDVKPFNKLRCENNTCISLDEHFIFETEFIDSLIVNRKVYKFAQRYADRSAQRATSSSGKVFAKTFAVRGKSTAVFSLTTSGTQYIAVVTEPKGLVTLRIHDIKHDEWYNDTEKTTDGLPCRIQVMELPKNEMSTLVIEVKNRSNRDISFVIIGN